jgi:hypothetical protein
VTTQTPAPATLPGGGDGPYSNVEQGSAQERVGQVSGTARDEAVHVAQTVKDQAGQVAQSTAGQARDLLDELRQQLRKQTDTQRQRIAEILGEFGDELQQMADNGGGSGTATEVVRQAAQRLRSVQGYLDRGPDMLDDVRSMARRRPAAFLFGAVLAGVLAGRATRGAAALRSESDHQGGADARIQTSNAPAVMQDSRFEDEVTPTGTLAVSERLSPDQSSFGSTGVVGSDLFEPAVDLDNRWPSR